MELDVTLEGVNFDKFKINKDDNQKKLFAERLEVLDGKLKYIKKYYEVFTAEVYNPNLKDDDPLSHTIRLFRLLDTYGSYLLSATDVKKDKTRDKHITKTSLDYDKSLIQKATKNHSNFEVAIASTFESTTTRYINTETVITEDDFKNSEYGSILQDYQNAKKILINKMLAMKNKIEESEENNKNNNDSLNKIISLLADINQDMKIIKQHHTENVQYAPTENINHYVSPSYKLDVIDYSKPKHIKAIIKEVDLFQNELLVGDGISEISYDITNTILNLHKKGILNDYELLLVRLKNSSNLNSVEIAHILGKCRKTVHNNYNAIVKKICNHHKKDK